MNLGIAQSQLVTGGGDSGVVSINSLTGVITLAAGTNITLTPSGNTITIDASGGSGGGTAFQTIQRCTEVIADATTTTFFVKGDTFTITSSAKIVGVATTTRGIAVEQNVASTYTLIGSNVYVTGRHLKFLVELYMTTTGDNATWIMLTENQGALGFQAHSPDTSVFGSSCAGFRCWNPTATPLETTWHAMSCDGTTMNLVDTGVTQDINSHNFAVVFDDDNSQLLYYIDGLLKATITTNLPLANKILCMYISEWFTASSFNVGISRIIVDSDL